MEPIRAGVTGAAVADVQRRLAALGLAVADENGRFGPLTERAVRRFQQHRHLVADGVVGHDTWAALIDAGYQLGDRLLYLTRPPLRGDDVRSLQRSLSRLGFDTGPTDGIHGPTTDTALRDFQHNAGVAVDGITGAATLAMLQGLWRKHQASTSFEVIERADTGRGPATLVGQRVLLDPILRASPERRSPAGVDEDAVAFDVARRVAGQLIGLGAHPMMTRADQRPVPASRRAAMANELDVSAIIIIGCGHHRSVQARGVAGQYFGDDAVASDRGRRLAELAVDGIAAATGAPNCHAHPSTSAVLRESRPPAIVVELGFISHPDEAQRLGDPGYRQILAMALTDALRTWASAIPTTAAAVAAEYTPV